MSDDDKVRIRIRTPLPLNVTGALTQLIGAAWPDAVLDTTDANHLTILVDPAKAVPVSDEQLAEVREEAAAESGGVFDGFGSDDNKAWIHVAPPEELCLFLGDIAHRIMETNSPEAINYLEWEIRTEERNLYVLSVSRSKAQTPHALRMVAEAKIDKVREALVSAAEFGDILDPQYIWDAIGEKPEDHLSEDAQLSYEGLRP